MLSISKLANTVKITIDTIKFYEKNELLLPKMKKLIIIGIRSSFIR